MKRFQIGDAVIVLRSGDLFYIAQVDHSDNNLPYRVYMPNNDYRPAWYSENELELLNVYESPLYQALK